MEALTPPAQLSEWHSQYVESFRTIQAILDTQPKDDVVEFANILLIAIASADLEETLGEVSARLPEDVRQQMIEAGCIDPEDLPDNYEAVPDDHGNSEGDATAIRVGADVRGALDYDDDIDFFRFQAERGQSYQIDVALGTLDDSIVDLYDADGSYLDASYDYGDPYASRLYWEAPSSGERYVAVYGYGTGTYTLTVSHSTIVDDHGNDFESATRLVIGEAVSLELENDDDIDVLVFRARPGTVYLLTLDWEYYSFRESSTERPLLAVYSSNGQEHTRLMGYDFSRISVPSIDLQWQAVTGGDYYIVIGDGNTEGAGAFYVSGEEATEPIASPTPTPRHTSTPRPTPTAGSFVSVSAGESYTCGVWSDGSVACWGAQGGGAATPPVGSFVSVTAGGWHTCGVRSNGSVACWGDNEDGQATPSAGPFDSVSVGGWHTCGLRSNGSVACWGDNEDGEATPPAGSFLSVSAGYGHTCGVMSDGSVACWGDDSLARPRRPRVPSSPSVPGRATPAG